MRKKSVAVMATVAALGVGAAVPSTGVAKTKKSAKAASVLDITGLCDALGLRPLLGGLKLDLSPIVRVTIIKICE